MKAKEILCKRDTTLNAVFAPGDLSRISTLRATLVVVQCSAVVVE